jgi:acyl-CoA thioesterase-1
MKNTGLIFCAVLLPLFTYFPSSSAEPKKTPIHIVVLGDSLTEGYGIEKDLAYPHLLDLKLQEYIRKNSKLKIDLKVYNAGISGSTSASSVSRLKWFIKTKPTHLFLALGANDGLRGVVTETTKKNLIDTIRLAKENNIKVLLAGMKMPPNYGEKFTKAFEQIFPQVANEEKIPLMPFLLQNVASVDTLNQTDGIHPNEKGHIVLAENVYQFLIKNIPELKQ